MKIAIIGLGGVGGYLLASLSKTSHDVIGFARGEHLLAIQNNGLQILEDHCSHTFDVNVDDIKNATGFFDLVIFCVKSYDLENAYLSIQPHIQSSSILISFSNGVANGELLKRLSFSNYVLDGTIYILSHIKEHGVIEKKSDVFLAVFGGNQEKTQELKNIFDEANLRNKTPKDIQTALWKKFIFISAFASLTSFYNRSIGYIYQHHKEDAKKLLTEISLVAEAKGIDVKSDISKALVSASKVPYESSTSMHLDFQNNNKTELQTLSYYIIEEAQKYCVSVPLMEKIYSFLSQK